MVQNLPTAEVYEKEFTYFPWGKLVREIEALIASRAPQNGSVIDLMCGPGYLLGKLEKVRPDLSLRGVDLEKEFIEYAKAQYPNVSLEVADASEWISDKTYDVVLCTAGIHHLPYERQEAFIEKLSHLAKPGGMVVIADPYVDDYSNETERKLVAAKLGYEYLAATINNGAPEDIVRAAADILANDVQMVEFKSSLKKVEPILEKYFSKIDMHKTWPDKDSEYGDYYFILGND